MTDFERFHAEEFPALLKAAQGERLSNGLDISESSWDRRAAFILWQALGRPEPRKPSPLPQVAKAIFEDLLG